MLRKPNLEKKVVQNLSGRVEKISFVKKFYVGTKLDPVLILMRTTIPRQRRGGIPTTFI
jgi:hypothetical protein